jgi:hypothetical protein
MGWRIEGRWNGVEKVVGHMGRTQTTQ